MKKIIMLGLTLFVVSSLSALLLSVTNSLTKDQIVSNETAKEVALENEIFPEADHFEPAPNEEMFTTENERILEVILAQKSGEQIGYILKILTSGYGGNVELLVGIDLDKNIVNVRAGKNAETAGIGSKVLQPEYLSQYQGVSLITDFEGDASPVDAITGATVTSTAVKRAMLDLVDIQEKLVPHEN